MADIECIHCGELVADCDHWRTCEQHPARTEIERLKATIATSERAVVYWWREWRALQGLSFSASVQPALQAADAINVACEALAQQDAKLRQLTHAIATLISKSHQYTGNLQIPYAWIAQRDWEEFLKEVATN